MINITLVLTEAGADTGPFDLYSDATSYTVPFQTGVPRATLQSGYGTTAPDGTTIVRVTSTSALCPVSIDITLQQQYTIDYTLFGGGPSLPSPNAKLQITINDVLIVDIGGDNPIDENNGICSFNSDDKVYIYTETTASEEYYQAASLSLEIANNVLYDDPILIFSDGGSITAVAGVFNKSYEYLKLPAEIWDYNIWTRANAEATPQ